MAASNSLSLEYITIWEYKNENGVWIPHQPNVCHMIEKAFITRQNSCHLTRFEIDFKTLIQRDKYTDETAPIRQQHYPGCGAIGRSVLWAWSDDYNWETYSVATIIFIETEYQQGKEIIDLFRSPLHIPNFIDVKNMVQVNKMTKRARPVRREIMKDKYPVYGELDDKSTMSYGETSHQSTSLYGDLEESGEVSGSSNFKDSEKVKMDKKTTEIVTRPISGVLAAVAVGVIHGQQLNDECAICLCDLSSEDTEEMMSSYNSLKPNVLKLLKCKHMFHHRCLKRMYDVTAKNGCLQCPTCKTIHGEMRGNQPSNGTMNVTTNHMDIPGYPGYGSIIISYYFTSGIQGSNHPNPGARYNAYGFPRTCYLPNNNKGKKVLSLLKKAFERQLIFTIGSSRTTGATETVTWNDIHHKTEGYSNTSGYGYPDTNYLDNVIAELASQGVTDN